MCQSEELYLYSPALQLLDPWIAIICQTGMKPQHADSSSSQRASLNESRSLLKK